MTQNNSIWVLTVEYNEYDQHGGYFVAAFKNKPTHKELIKVGLVETEASHVVENDGGRRGVEHNWYELERVEFGKNYHD